MKRTALKRKSKSAIRKVQDLLWAECRRIIKKRYGNTCYTCGRAGLEGANWQIGHFIPSGACGAGLRYDLRNLRPQCMRCNIHLGGNGAEYMRAMLKEVGNISVEQLFKDKQKIVKAQDHYEKLLQEYKTLDL